MSFLGGLVGTIVGGMISHHNAKSQADHNADLSRSNWEYQQSNAHQLEVQDLKNAGLNPILSATNSQMAGISPVQGSDPGNFANNLTSAIQAEFDRQAKKEMQASDLEIERLRAQIEQTRAETEKFKAEAYANVANSEANLNSARVTNETNLANARIEEIHQNVENSISDLRSLIALREKQGFLASSQSAYYNKLVDKTVEEIGKAIQERTGQALSNEQIIRQLQDPDNAIHRDYRGSWIGKAIGYLGEVVRDVSPFKGYSVSNRGVAGRN